jgi:serine/threonine-protein kinase
VVTGIESRLPSAVTSIDAALSAVREFSRSVWLDLVRRDQCERWRSGRRVSAETYFQLLPELRSDREEMLVLICGEMRLRQEEGDAVTLDEFERRFPDLAADIAIQYDLDRFLDRDSKQSPADESSIKLPVGRLPGYEILREIGRGASGIIYLARQVSINRFVAMKAIALSVADAQRLSRQRQEASILSRLQHPHIVQIYDVIESNGMMWLVIEYVDGRNLLEHTAGKPQPPKEAARLVRTLAETIHVVHDAGILHRDLKPSNILLTSKGDPKITDFGLAKLLAGDNQLTTDNCLLGTPCYMPPEQASANSGSVGRPGDVYSLGAILYELITGRPPFLGVTILDTLSLIRDREPVPCRASQPKTPRDLETICLKCLEKMPERRYSTAAALATDLERFLAGEAIEARRPSWKEQAVRWYRRKPGIAILSLSLALAIIAGFCGILWQWRQTADAHQLAEQRATEIQQKSERLKGAIALVEQGHVFSELRRWDDAMNALDKAVVVCPELSSAWDERGQLYAQLGLWDRALEDRRRAFDINEPALAEEWRSCVTLVAHAGDADGYRRLCSRMRERFQGYGGLIAADLVRTCCLMPADNTDYSFLVELMHLATGHLRVSRRQIPEPLYMYAEGLAEYRAGRYDDAIASCLGSLRAGEEWVECSLNFPVLALAYEGRGDVDKAKSFLEQAAQADDHWIQDLYTSGEKNWVLHKGASGDWEITPFSWLEFNLLFNEARDRLHQPRPSDDPRLIVLQARAFAAIRRFKEADATYKRAVVFAPHDDRIRMEYLRCQAYWRLDLNDFAGAAHLLAAVTRFDPDDIRLWDNLGQAYLAAGDLDAYRQECREMIRRFAHTTDPTIADRVVWMCANRASAVPNLEELLPLADLAVSGYPGAARTKGALLLRIGRYAEALKSFAAASRFNVPHPFDMCLQAIACHHLGRIKQSQQFFDEAARWIDEANRLELPDVAQKKPSWSNMGWNDRLEALRLFAEAKALVSQGGAIR